MIPRMQTAASHVDADERAYRRRVRAWCLYDWANSAFATTVMAAMFPPFYRSLAESAGKSGGQATSYFAYTAALATAVVVPLAPILGAAADRSAGKKRYLAFFVALGAAATACFVFIGPHAWLLASALFIIGNIGFNAAEPFYDALLPHVARPGDIDRVSTAGYALGYIGGGVLLLINLAWYTWPQSFGMPDAGFAVRASFVSVAVWWAAFSIPLFRRVPEPPAACDPCRNGGAVRASLARLADTARHIRQYRQALLMLVAFLIYNDGISTIFKMATAYGDDIGIETGHMIAALVITQFVGVPAAFGFGYLARFTGPKRAILLGLGIYVGVCIGGYYMRTATHFYMLAAAVGLTQGGTQALSRSLFGRMVPRDRSAEFFGFFSTTSKFGAVLGPLVFGLVTQATGRASLAIIFVAAFFVIGGALLVLVDVDEGVRAAGPPPL